ncbi:probable receptor-like protein kinase At5g61350 [Lotus japonicus]|uniref:probable receptor-like protein kinase At5g61350 n=1 Tax=Lotus japonicus TaxID=34305 RepID=UPI002590EBC8|nr:probable receptor-like protein kinase At5g61350 [Lotus japonicus]
MKNEDKRVVKFPFIFSLFSIIFLNLTTNCASSTTDPSFSPSVNYLIDCGSSNATHLKDGRTFKSDRETTSLLSTTEDLQISVDSININTPPSLPSSSLPLFQSARVLREESAYTFYISKPGRLFVRLYFFPLPDPSFNLTSAVFSVQTDHVVLLHEFSVRKNDSLVFKEYLVNVPDSRFSLKFKPKKESFAFINAVEVVSAPDTLILDSATAVSLSPIGEFKGLLNSALQVSYRVNVGGPTINPENDTLSRTWEPDVPYNTFPQGSTSVAVSKKTIKYPKTGATPLIAPNLVYETAVQMQDPEVMHPNFNLTWMMNVEKSYSYLIRMHFCDIVSKSLNQLYFNVYINGIEVVSALDLSSETKALATAFYKDFVLNDSAITNGSIQVQVGPANLKQGTANAILNGIEVMKMSNSADSLDGFFNVEGKFKGPGSTSTAMKIAAGVGLGLALIALVLLLVICIRWQRRPEEWEKLGPFSSWILPLRSPCTTRLFSSKSRTQSSTTRLTSRKSKNAHSVHHHSPRGPGRFFPFNELQQATQNFDEKRVIGVGGFGNVYLGTLEDGTKVAVKRGNGSTEQGINEFRTELNMLSNLRHRHLVSLMGFCDEDNEMVLVYEYMANGSFRSHLYGSSNFPLLPWQKRLEICIGAARGLHYLHTGATESIVHRDVKTTNILLDENYVAKVSDFGLSKAVPDEAQVSTAVKGSFGYLDPEYYRSQQLTQKSDIYSFGVVLVEVLCARPVVCPSLPREQANLADWAMQQHRRGMFHEIIDPRIVDTISPQSLKTFMLIAEKCLADQGVDRPSMGDVLWHLENALKLQIDDEPGNRRTDSTTSDQHPNKCDKIADHSSAAHTSDVSDRTDDDSASLFSQMVNLQGR